MDPLRLFLLDQGTPVEYELDKFNTPHTGTALFHPLNWLCRFRCLIPLRHLATTSPLGNIFWWHSTSHRNNQKHKLTVTPKFISSNGKHDFRNILWTYLPCTSNNTRCYLYSLITPFCLFTSFLSHEACSTNANSIFHAAVENNKNILLAKKVLDFCSLADLHELKATRPWKIHYSSQPAPLAVMAAQLKQRPPQLAKLIRVATSLFKIVNKSRRNDRDYVQYAKLYLLRQMQCLFVSEERRFCWILMTVSYPAWSQILTTQRERGEKLTRLDFMTTRFGTRCCCLEIHILLDYQDSKYLGISATLNKQLNKRRISLQLKYTYFIRNRPKSLNDVK